MSEIAEIHGCEQDTHPLAQTLVGRTNKKKTKQIKNKYGTRNVLDTPKIVATLDRVLQRSIKGSSRQNTALPCMD